MRLYGESFGRNKAGRQDFDDNWNRKWVCARSALLFWPKKNCFFFWLTETDGETTPYQPLYRRKYPILVLTIVSSKTPHINHFIVENTQFQPLCPTQHSLSTIVWTKIPNFTHFIVENTQYQPLYSRKYPLSIMVRRKYPLSTMIPSKIPDINHCVDETTH